MNEIRDLVKDEVKFCNEIACEKNEHGNFIYSSTNGASTINLPYILMEYKQWLIDNKILKKKEN